MKKLVISGYGKMGKEIEKVAIEKGWKIAAITDNAADWKSKAADIKTADVIIDFSMPAAVMDNIERAFELNIPVVVGTTGRHKEISALKQRCETEGKTLIYASNFSIGVNIFFEINKKLAEMMNGHHGYEPAIEEIHHTEKLDSPSGTAITLAGQIIENLERKNVFVNHNSNKAEELSIISKRIAGVPGTHIVNYISEIDEIEIKHTAKSRRGFAEGAVWAAGKAVKLKGFHYFSDILFNKL